MGQTGKTSIAKPYKIGLKDFPFGDDLIKHCLGGTTEMFIITYTAPYSIQQI